MVWCMRKITFNLFKKLKIKNFSKISIFLLFVSFLAFKSAPVDAASGDVTGYPITKGTDGKKAIAINCFDSSKDIADQSLCEKYSTLQGSNCEAVESTLTREEPIYMCNSPGEIYCMRDTDCTSLGKGVCVVKKGSSKRFEDQFTGDSKEDEMEQETDYIGICASFGGTSENNTFSQAICNAIKIVTGNVGRAVSGVAFIVLGIMFFFGKVTWGIVLAVICGMGAIFGYDSIVTIITGKPFRCG